MEPFRTCAQVDLDAMERNFCRVRGLLAPGCQIMAVLKADAYGHGLRACLPACEPHVTHYGVATLEEALALREEGTQKEILIFGAVDPAQMELAARQRLTLNLFSAEYAAAAAGAGLRAGVPVRGHIKLDTGLNRTGLRCRVGQEEQAAQAAAALYALPGLEVRGIYTHFACPDSPDPGDQAFTQSQFAAYQRTCQLLQARGVRLGLRHCASTGAILLLPHTHLDMVRTGMLQYGQSISEESIRQLGLEPILQWQARIVETHWVQPGESVSYGRLFRAQKPTRVAVVAAGYGDGYPRRLSGRAQALLGGRRVPVLGKVCMDYLMVDATDVPGAQAGDLVTLLGRDGEACISPNELCALTDGVIGEVTCAISARVPRVYLRGGREIARRCAFR